MKRVWIILLCLSVQPQQEHTIYLPVVMKPWNEPRSGVGSTYERCEDMLGEWFYNWGVNPPLCDGVQAVPMIWNENSIGQELGGNSNWVMGFNEPEMQSQADLTPQEAAVYWADLEQAYQGRKLTTPCVTNLSWLTEWDSEYRRIYGMPPRVDAVCVHCYGVWNAQASIAKCTYFLDTSIEWARERDIQEVWVSEFAHLPCWEDGDQGTLDFMQGMYDYFEQSPEITRDAWFQLTYKGNEPWAFGEYCNTSLVDYYTGQLTVFGELYKEFLND